MFYPAKFEPAQEGGYVVTFRDLPEAITQGDTLEEAMAMAEDVLLFAMEHYFENRLQAPVPSKAKKGETLVELPAMVSAKVLLLNEMLSQGVSNAELARRLGTSAQNAQRIFDLHHQTKIDTVAKAVHCLGKNLEMSLA